MIEVITFTKKGNRIDTAEAETREAALIAARTLWRDSRENRTGVAAVGFYTDGRLDRMHDRCP